MAKLAQDCYVFTAMQHMSLHMNWNQGQPVLSDYVYMLFLRIILGVSHKCRSHMFTMMPSEEQIRNLTLILLTWRIEWASNNASKRQMEFNSAFKGLIFTSERQQRDRCVLNGQSRRRRNIEEWNYKKKRACIIPYSSSGLELLSYADCLWVKVCSWIPAT
jgi:hypothetical protein